MSAIAEYAALASEVIAAHRELSDADIFRPVHKFLPRSGTQVLDIGAGTGRTAAWLAQAGSRVTAVEPVAAFRTAGQARFQQAPIRWIDDSLPDLKQTIALDEQFDTIILCGVWHHITPHHRSIAVHRMRRLLNATGRIILSLRHGPAAPGLTTFAIDPDDTLALAKTCGLTLEYQTTSASVQPKNQTNGVTWTWLVLAPADNSPNAHQTS